MTRGLAVVIAFALTGCSVLVEPDAQVRCRPEIGCPGGLLCRVMPGETEGTCGEPCTITNDGQELCNGVNEDCDAFIDEGNDGDGDGTISPVESFDQDEDGYNVCGSQDCVGAPDEECILGEPDCNDGDASINPGEVEQCDNIDHDCDSLAVPESLDVLDANCDSLAMGTICEPGLGCVPDDCRAPRNTCMDEQFCDTLMNPPMCREAACSQAECAASSQWCDGEVCRSRLPNGTHCTLDVQCTSGVCLEPAVVRLPGSVGNPPVEVTLPTGSICMETCCADTDCAANEFCWDGGNGARTCLPVEVGAATTGRTTLGGGGPDTGCGTGADCRSGRCEGSRCLSPCRGDSQCGSGQTCSLVEVQVAGAERSIMACVSGRADSGTCSDSLDCDLLCCDVLRDPFVGAVIDVDCFRDQGFIDNECVGGSFCTNDAECGSDGCNYFTTPNLAQGVIALCGGSPTGTCCNSRQCPGGVCRPQLGTGGGENWLMFCDLP